MGPKGYSQSTPIGTHFRAKIDLVADERIEERVIRNQETLGLPELELGLIRRLRPRIASVR